MQDDEYQLGHADGSVADKRMPVDPDVQATVGDRASTHASPIGRARWLQRSRWDILLVIGFGGALGSLGRWALGQALGTPRGGFPWATCLENISGGLALGMLMVFVVDVWPPSRYVRPFLGVGVLGGYTTFSTYMLDTRSLIEGGRVAMAGAYVFGTLAAGLMAVWAGIALARGIVRFGERRWHRGPAGNHHTRRQ